MPSASRTPLASRGVRVGLVRGLIRAVTHLDVSRRDIETTLATVATIADSYFGGMVSNRGTPSATS
ncbi:hypothetical protein EJ065_1752 [Corallococcus coralloides]|uniref:Uncharacterized protein n=1 Tax=Corallococcus coralloides TaxID=184914 RepID=A0A410RN35_CORCK|nr:hypothetical protein EJ065_1752 [Corallococcus coralloides]